MADFDKIIVTDITDIVSVHSPKGRFVKMQDRKTYGISFCAEGQITYTHNGREFVSDPEHAILLPKGSTYNIRGDKTGVFPVINFECANFESDTFITFPIKNASALLFNFEQMAHNSLRDGNRAKMMSLFYNIIHILSYSENTSSRTLLPAIKFLEENFASPDLTNKILAEKCKISEVYFRKLFLQNFGVTAKQYIIDIRINNAMKLLQGAYLSIGNISEKCGFSNPYHFSRIFKAKTGFTPTEYMNRNKITTI